jgi:cytoskeletal protein CcmA (bactofilin family)
MPLFSSNKIDHSTPAPTPVAPTTNGSAANGSGTNGHKTGPLFRAVLSQGVSIKGSVKFRSELVIDGEVEGTIQSLGRLTVGRNAHIRGEVRTRSITVHGTVDGNLTAEERCELRSGCTLRGDIETSRLVVDENANFVGSAEIAMQDYLSELRGKQNGS